MKFISDFLHKKFEQARPMFEKGGKFEKLYPLYEAKETFLFVSKQATSKGSHIRDPLDTKRLMSTVIAALIPCLFFGIFNVGYQYYSAQGLALNEMNPLHVFGIGLRYVVPIIIVSYAAGGVWEVLFSVVRKHEINEGFLVTGMLVPLIVPPSIPLWQVAVGVSFGVVIGKEVFGGTGMNVFNPALVARAFIFFAYPASISGDKPWVQQLVTANDLKLVDGYSGATPLLVAAGEKTGTVIETLNNFGVAGDSRFANFSLCNAFVGLVPGSIGETSTLAILLGAGLLIATGIGSWRIMLSAVVGVVVMACGMNLVAPSTSSILAMPAHYHLVYGGFAFAAVFMATDPVSASHTNIGKLIYGFLIGVMTVLIRCVNPAYPEGAMLAVLFMNAFAPLIDYFVVDTHIKRRMRRAQVL